MLYIPARIGGPLNRPLDDVILSGFAAMRQCLNGIVTNFR